MPKDNLQELFYHVDPNDQVLGFISRDEAHSGSMKNHRSVGIFIFNENDELLLQKRSCNKDIDPCKWSYSVSGHVTFGQTYEEAAIREVQEEVGIEKIKLSFITKQIVTTKFEVETTSFYKTKFNSKKNKIFKADDELEEIRWVSVEKLPSFIKKNNFTDWSLTAFHLIGIGT